MNNTRTIVFRLNRRKKIAIICGIVFSLVLLLIGGCFIYSTGIADGRQAVEQNELMTAELAELQASFRGEQQRAVTAEKSAEIDRLAAEAVRKELLSYRNELAELKTSVDFYRGLMAPDELEKGLALHGFHVSFNKRTNSYQYKALVTQAGGKNQLLKGKFDISLVVESSDASAKNSIQTFALSDLPGFNGNLPTKLRFRFFQTIEGAFKLPDHLTPVSMVIALESTGKAVQKINKTFNWQDLLGAH
ncbi:hypothetical protein N9123_00225 [Pseudomonadales bacterium]|nr:hypothetical protein [Pseudomonadales bacterium]